MTTRTEPASRNWLGLPAEVTSLILSKVSGIDILLSVQYVCYSWFKICKEPSMWRTIDMYNYESEGYKPVTMSRDKMFRRALELSKGQVTYINIQFGNDYHLNYMADRCKNLRRLRLAHCSPISDEALGYVASNVRLLEELELLFCPFTWQALESFGVCCPLLKSLKLNYEEGTLRCDCDEDALVIAQYMHGLRHLELVGNSLTNVGLEAILDSCPDLESLDLRECFNINMEGDLEKRCVDRIRDLRRPHDPIDD